MSSRAPWSVGVKFALVVVCSNFINQSLYSIFVPRGIAESLIDDDHHWAVQWIISIQDD